MFQKLFFKILNLKMTSSIDIIYWWNSRLSILLGLLANFWFLWLVLYRTPKEMMAHSRILLQTCTLDIISLTISTIGMPLELESNGIWLFLIDGILFDQFYTLFGTLGALLLAEFYFVFNILEIIGISLQFVYRYLLLNRNFQIGFCRYMILLLIPFIFILCFYSYFSIRVYPLAKIRSGNAQELFHIVDLNEWKFYFTLNTNEINPIMIAGHNLLVTFIVYAIITFCAVKMIKFVNAHTGFSENTKRLNKQLTKTLIILSILPLIFTLFALLNTLNIAITSNDAATTNNLIAQGVANQSFILLPILNPLVSIAINSPYRNAAMFWRKKIEPKPAAAMIVQNVR